jgi:DNA polymerase III subunit epsilon
VLDQPLVFLDVETTGMNPVYDRITEVGLIEIEPGGQAIEWSSLVNPGVRIPPTIQTITGISDAMVALAPAFGEIARPLLARLEGKLLVAHNARFDYGFLRNEFRRAGHRYASRVLCTVKLSRKLYPQESRHNLDALMGRHGVECDARHRALGDARAIWRLMQLWERAIEPAHITAAVEALVKTPAGPAGLPEGALDDIPEAPGVYLFYGENDAALYVGKSINLRSRVLAHFAGDHRDARDMKIAQEVRRVDWVETPGELAALIEEARLVKSLAPVYNRRMRRATELCAWRWCPEEPASAPRLVTARELEETGFDDLHGLFRSRATALQALREISTAHQLCRIVLGLEQGKGPCLAHQSKRCRGACVGKESALVHGLRLAAALAQLKMRPWPFKGRVGVREGSRDAVIVLDRWCYLGTARTEAELAELTQRRSRPAFDLDTYKILARFFGRSRRNYHVVELAA